MLIRFVSFAAQGRSSSSTIVLMLAPVQRDTGNGRCTLASALTLGTAFSVVAVVALPSHYLRARRVRALQRLTGSGK